MKPAYAIEFYLKQRNVSYTIISHQPTTSLEEAANAAKIDLSRLVRAVIMHDNSGVIMVVLPANHLVDFSALQAQLGRTLELASVQEIADLFIDCQSKTIPPLAEHYGLQAIIDSKLSELDKIYFEPGSHNCLVSMKGSDFQRLHSTAKWGVISRPSSQLASNDDYEFVIPDAMEHHHEIHSLLPANDIKERISRVRQFPPMPEMAHRLMLLRNNPHATIGDLAAIVAFDPSLAAQVVRYARSAFFAYRGQVDSINDAILRVLGFDMVMNMALGLAVGKSFRILAEGPLGSHAVWRHAVYSAALSQALCDIMPAAMRPKPDLAYLAGLLHNFGFLLMGHLLKPELFLLKKTVAANPNVPVTLIEKRLLGIGHKKIGSWLMSSWGMPAQVIVTLEEHHNEHYQGDHANYANLVLLVDHLLKAYGIGDAAVDEAPPVILTTLGIDPEKAKVVTERILEEQAELDAMALQLTA